jgi:thioesterase domain-containing protein
MRRKHNLPPSPLAPRQLVKFDLADPEQARASFVYLRDRLSRLARDKKEFPSEFDRLLASAEAWCSAVYAEERLKPNWVASDDLYPQRVWYASQIRSLAAEIRRLREREPDLVLGIALTLGELIGEARAHLTHGEDAARGLKAMSSARSGHEQVHGTKEMKDARWRGHVSAFQRYRANGHSITAAEGLAAEERGVSSKTIFNARRWAKVE